MTRTIEGRFAKGNSGGPGRPRRETERAYLTALAAVCTPAEWGEIVGRAVADAKEGDPKAREWLAVYLLGRPEQTAPTLHQLAVDEEAAVDPVAEDAFLRSLGKLS